MTEATDASLQQCYNRGCGAKFDPRDNPETGCTFHPGVPFFHETYKGWTCCNKKTTDFTEFLDIKGCSRSRHSNVKPPEPEKPVQVEEEVKPEPVRVPIYVPMERPSQEAPMVPMARIVNPNLLKQVKTLLEAKDGGDSVEKEGSGGGVKMGTMCKNSGCSASYSGPESDLKTCLYHKGIPVFHEGLKYWSCCTKRTTDFDAFLEQVGCVEGCHIWVKPKVEPQDEDRSKSCRFDWHQTEDRVVVSVYSKLPLPDSSHVEVNPVKLKASIVFGEDAKIFEVTFDLFGVIDVSQSKVTFLGSKVEICMKKAEPVSWGRLTIN